MREHTHHEAEKPQQVSFMRFRQARKETKWNQAWDQKLRYELEETVSSWMFEASVKFLLSARGCEDFSGRVCFRLS